MALSAREKADRVFGPGPVPVCWLNFPSPEIAEVAAESGFPAAVIDLEHTAISLESAQRMMMAMKGTGMRPMVRLPEVSTGLTKRVLDIGAVGIVLPYVESVEEVKKTIEDMTYGPRGKRGLASYVNRASRYGADPAGAVKRADEENILIVMIESRAGVALAPELAAIEGVDALFFGPSDYSFEAGRIDMGSQEMLDAYAAIEKAARGAGKMMGTAPFGTMTPPRLAELGCDFFAATADVVTLRNGFTGAVNAVREAAAKR
ncbi:MAG: hypothetical protein KF874_03070 [Rhizobiaceae bacterium]|nr:hypothetical protein [Rhizobiaceae bacterium]